MLCTRFVFIILFLVAAALIGFLVAGRGRDAAATGDTTLVMFCAAGMKAPVSEIARRYHEEYGVTVQLQYGGSGTLLSSLEVAPGDIYLAADSSYTTLAVESGLVAEAMPVSFLTGGFGVPVGNPKNITTLADLRRPGLRVGIANPEAASVGKFTQKILSDHGQWDDLKPEVLLPTVNELANALKLGTIDVAILWDAIANQYPEIDFIHLPEFDAEKQDITVGVLASSSQPTAALKFCRYLTARDRGIEVFKSTGYETLPDADIWKETPEILLFSGAMLRPALEDTIAAFEAREGVRITPVYNGCGILVAQMNAGEKPDAYFSCDTKFMEMVQDRFLEPTTVSANEMVIITEKGNPRQILTLADLATPGLRLGFAHPEKSALGFLTKHLLDGENLYESIIAAGNLKVDSPTGDFLVNQLKAGYLDAVIVYRSNALADESTAEGYDIIAIDRPNAISHQPWAIGKSSGHKHLLDRFYKTAVSAESKEIFLRHGFRWAVK